MSKNFYYFPILKTTEAELKAYNSLNDSVKNNILPIFELTKSRKTKKNPDSELKYKLDKLQETIGNRPFIIDLTIESTYSNKEIEKMIYNGDNGYNNWVSFLKEQRQKFTIIPTVHYHPNKLEDVKKQIDSLKRKFNYIAFRAELFQSETPKYIEDLLNFCSPNSHKNVIIILDGKFIRINDQPKIDKYKKEIKKVTALAKECPLICAFSSFPKSVIDYDGGDSKGEFDTIEITINQQIISELNKNKVYYGDYGTIHPIRYDTGGGGWVPRIDVPYKDKIFYYRYRRDKGSYPLCAKKIINDKRYKKIPDVNSWGDEEILYASKGEPRGKSPSHWIAVRSNLHMTRQYLRLSKEENQFLSLSL